MEKSNLSLATAWEALVAAMLNPVATVKSPNGKLVDIDFRKVPAEIGLEMVRKGGEKMLSDISAGSTKGGTANDVHEQRTKKRDAWYNGDLTLKGGGTADPVAVQMRVDILSALTKQGVTDADPAHKEFRKGTAVQILGRMYEGDELKAKIEAFRSAARETLEARGKAKIDLTKIKL